MANEENKKIEDKKLNKVDGGGFFSQHTLEEYKKAGVEVVGPGYLYNDGYKFQGKEISTKDANVLAFFTYYYGRPANSLEEAYDYYDYMESVLN